MGFPCHTQWWRLALLLPKWPSPALPRASVSVGVGMCNVAHHLCPSTERVTQSGNTQVKDEIRHAGQFLCMGRNVWIPKVSQARTQTASCAQVSAYPLHTPHPPGAEGPAAQREPAGIFPAGTWGQGLRLCVLSSHPSCLSAPRGMAETHNLIYLLCLESHRDWREGGPMWSLWTHRTHILAVLILWLEGPSPGISSGAVVQGSSHMVQEDACVASTQTVVDLVDLEGWCCVALQKSWGHTHFSQMGRKVQCHLGENSRESALPAVQGLCCTDAHTRTCSHVHAQTHTHFYTHAHAPTCTHTLLHTHTHRWACTIRAQRMGTFSKSVCRLLLPSFSLDFSAGVRCQYSSGSGWSQWSPSPWAGNLHPPNCIGSSDILLVPRLLRSPQRLSQSPF